MHSLGTFLWVQVFFFFFFLSTCNLLTINNYWYNQLAVIAQSSICTYYQIPILEDSKREFSSQHLIIIIAKICKAFHLATTEKMYWKPKMWLNMLCYVWGFKWWPIKTWFLLIQSILFGIGHQKVTRPLQYSVGSVLRGRLSWSCESPE